MSLENKYLTEETKTDIRSVADEFTRFLIGDRKRAISNLTKMANTDIKGIDDGVLKDIVDEKGKFTRDYNKIFNDLYDNLHKGIEKTVKKHS